MGGRVCRGERHGWTYTENDGAQLFLGKNMGHLLYREKEKEGETEMGRKREFRKSRRREGEK